MMSWPCPGFASALQLMKPYFYYETGVWVLLSCVFFFFSFLPSPRVAGGGWVVGAGTAVKKDLHLVRGERSFELKYDMSSFSLGSDLLLLMFCIVSATRALHTKAHTYVWYPLCHCPGSYPTTRQAKLNGSRVNQQIGFCFFFLFFCTLGASSGGLEPLRTGA